jgi:hypothetical protein
MIAECRSLSLAATRKATGQFTAVFTNRPLRKSFSRFAQAAAASAAENKPRKTPSWKALAPLKHATE